MSRRTQDLVSSKYLGVLRSDKVLSKTLPECYLLGEKEQEPILLGQNIALGLVFS